MISNNFPSISIVIVNYNGINLLRRCMESLASTEYPNFDIILVDNNSTDGSINFIKDNFPSCKIIPLHNNVGFSRANNLAARESSSKYLVFLNNDTYVDPNWLKELVAVIDNDDSIVIAQSLLLKPNGEVDSSGDFATKYGIAYSSKASDLDGPHQILSAKGAAMIIRRDFFLSLGGFDEDFFITFEDVEIGWKANILGYKVVIVPTSIVYHLGGATANKMNSIMTFHGLKNQLSLLTTHFEASRSMICLGLYFARLIVGFFRLVVNIGLEKDYHSNVDKKAAIRAVLWYFANFIKIYNKHKKINSLRIRSTTDLINLKVITDNMRSNVH